MMAPGKISVHCWCKLHTVYYMFSCINMVRYFIRIAKVNIENKNYIYN